MPNEPRNRGQVRIWTPSNVITLFRICLVPVFVVALISPWPEWFGVLDVVDDQVKAWISAAIFIIISCTDWLDGYLARRRNEVTDLGKFLDPLADKILVAAALIALVELDVLPSWPALVILTREFIVSGIRMVAASKGYVIAASWYGKAKTVLQIVAIVLFLVKGEADLGQAQHTIIYVIAWIVMIAALVMTIVSMLDYISKARPLLFPKKSDSKLQEELDREAPDGSVAEKVIDDEAICRARSLIDIAREKQISIGTAESLTGGLICATLTAVAGSSDVVLGSCVTYATRLKHEMLGVDATLLAEEGPVNETTALEMAEGAARVLGADITVSVTGIAGPSGGTEQDPVGTVWMGIYDRGVCNASRLSLEGDRDEVRRRTVICAIGALEDALLDR